MSKRHLSVQLPESSTRDKWSVSNYLHHQYVLFTVIADYKKMWRREKTAPLPLCSKLPDVSFNSLMVAESTWSFRDKTWYLVTVKQCQGKGEEVGEMKCPRCHSPPAAISPAGYGQLLSSQEASRTTNTFVWKLLQPSPWTGGWPGAILPALRMPPTGKPPKGSL